jgi:hypothetical protein
MIQTYGIQLVTKEEYENRTDEWYKSGGCRERLLKCQNQAKEEDPDWRGNVPSVIKCFKEFDSLCNVIETMVNYPKDKNVRLSYDHLQFYSVFRVNRSSLDGMISLILTQTQHQSLVRLIISMLLDIKTDLIIDMHGYLNLAWVLEALGVPVNYTAASYAVGKAFDDTRDFDRAGASEAVSYLLDSGVKVHMVYGDRDFACGWIGGEAASLAIEYSGSKHFKHAGYAPILSSGWS